MTPRLARGLQAQGSGRIASAREPRRLPVVPGAGEVVRFLEAVPSPKARGALATACAARLWVSEVIGLRVRDIGGGRMTIRIERGKAGKERWVTLSRKLLGILRICLRLARPTHWRVHGRDPSRPCCRPPAAPRGRRRGSTGR